MAFCTNCGAKIEADAKFCPECGARTESAGQAQTAAVVQAQPAPEPPKAEPKPPKAPSVQGIYTPPTQKNTYTPPVQAGGSAQGSYTPPAQKSTYTPPVQAGGSAQGSYTPPARQSYAPKSGPAKAACTPTARAAGSSRQKTPLNRRTLLLIGIAALAVVLAIVLISSCGKGKKADAADPNLGVYNASTAEMMGIELSVVDMYADGFSIELKEKGKCAFNVSGTKGSGTWKLDGTELHIEGSGMTFDGTLSEGEMRLEDLFDSGLNMVLLLEGGYREPDAAGTDDSGKTSGTGILSGNAGGSPSSATASALQKQWNGTWHGCLYVSESTGDFAGIASDRYDVYMVVDVDADGKGTFNVYLDNVDTAFATATCEARESGLYAVEGTVAGGVEMYAYNWMFLPMRDYPDQYAMNDEIKDGKSVFTFTLFMKQWGGSWQDEIDSNFAIVPPSVAEYGEAIARGELPPVGFAPIGYDGSASAGTQQPAATDKPSATEKPSATAKPSATDKPSTTAKPSTALAPGEPSSTGDGMLKSLDDLYKLTKWLWNMEYSYKDTYCTYDFVVKYCGVQGLDDGNHGPNSVNALGDHYFFWQFDKTRYIFAGFRPNKAGDWVLVNMNTNGFVVADIPDSITVSYETASSLGAGKSEFAGELSATIDCFMTDVKTNVTLTVPDAGWCYETSSSDVRVYNVASLDKQGSNSPIIKFNCQSTLDRINFYYKNFENVKEIADRTIGGVNMKGRTYKNVGMNWTEYYGELPSGVWMSITISKIDLSAGGEGDAILNSVKIR